jgi:hypothetical protein
MLHLIDKELKSMTMNIVLAFLIVALNGADSVTTAYGLKGNNIELNLFARWIFSKRGGFAISTALKLLLSAAFAGLAVYGRADMMLIIGTAVMEFVVLWNIIQIIKRKLWLLKWRKILGVSNW